jgi:ribosomal protein S6
MVFNMDVRTYDLTVAYPVDESAEQLEKTVESMLNKAKVKVVSTDDWGQKTLSFPLKKHDEAGFKHMHLEAEADQIEVLKNQLKLERGLLRWLLVTA